MNHNNYLQKNKHAWNERTKVHIGSDFYNHQSFLQGENSLKEIELALLGNVRGKKILHLQCHFGQDTLSLARLGADVTGVDFSDEAIRIARETAEALSLNANFICCDIYDLTDHLNEEFDIVFTSYGTIGWLPDLNRWSEIVARFLKPEAEFVFVEFHPMVWMYDNDLTYIQYSYFQDDMIVEIEGTYADKDSTTKSEIISWNHAMSEVVQHLLNKKLELINFQEYNYSPYNVFPDCIEVGPSCYQVKKWENKMPMVYSLKMRKNMSEH